MRALNVLFQILSPFWFILCKRENSESYWRRKKRDCASDTVFQVSDTKHLLPLLLAVKSCKIGIKVRLIHLLFSNDDLDHCLLLLSIAGASMFFPRYSGMGC